jgi:hypothetical protein
MLVRTVQEQDARRSTLKRSHPELTGRQSRSQNRAMAILAMPEHGQDARGTKSARSVPSAIHEFVDDAWQETAGCRL